MTIISVVNRKGGVGKTTLTIGLADAILSERKLPTTIVDLDPQASASQALLSDADYETVIREGLSLAELLDTEFAPSDLSRFSRGALNVIQGSLGSDLRLYPNCERFWNLENEHFASDQGTDLKRRVTKLLGAEAALERTVIVDCPPGQSLATLAAIRASDLVLCPITPDRMALWGKDLLRQYIAKNAPEIRCRFVVTRAGLTGTAVRAALQELADSDEMLRTWAGRTTGGARDELALFSNATAVNRRIQAARPRTLSQFYGNRGARELTAIVDAVLKETRAHG